MNVLLGNADQQVKTYKHDKLEVFGEGADQSDRFWTTLIRQAVLAGYLHKDIDNYGLLKISDKAEAFIDNPESFKIALDTSFEDTESDDDEDFNGGGAGGAADTQLFEMLKNLRKTVAKNMNVPPFVVFQDPSLEEMTTNYPITMDELKNITGLVQVKQPNMVNHLLS